MIERVKRRFIKSSDFDMPSYVSNKVISRPARILMIGWFIAGFTFVVGGVFPRIDVNPEIAQAPLTEAILGVLLMIGASLMSCSTLNWRNDSTAWQLELVALPILMASWAMYVTLILFSDADSLFPLSIGIAFIGYCAMRLYEVNKFIRLTRKHVEEMNGGKHA